MVDLEVILGSGSFCLFLTSSIQKACSECVPCARQCAGLWPPRETLMQSGTAVHHCYPCPRSPEHTAKCPVLGEPCSVLSLPYFILASSFNYLSKTSWIAFLHASQPLSPPKWPIFLSHYPISFIQHFQYTSKTSWWCSPWKCFFHLSLPPHLLSTILISATMSSFLDLWKPRGWVLISFILCFRIH